MPKSEQERIEEALDTLSDIQKLSSEELENSRHYERRTAAEEVLRHYREGELLREVREHGLKIKVVLDSPIPVRPMTRAEMQS